METKEIATKLANGSITFENREDRVEDIPWNRHPKFKGVYLRHLVKGADTGGTLSCHVVRLDPGAILEDHIHESQWEVHEVVEGQGTFFLGSRETAYYPGRMAVIPRGAMHRVIAGTSGLVLLAKFSPPLV
jgi:quercetin dioxygenase-like cupin family protein